MYVCLMVYVLSINTFQYFATIWLAGSNPVRGRARRSAGLILTIRRQSMHQGWRIDNFLERQYGADVLECMKCGHTNGGSVVDSRVIFENGCCRRGAICEICVQDLNGGRRSTDQIAINVMPRCSIVCGGCRQPVNSELRCFFNGIRRIPCGAQLKVSCGNWTLLSKQFQIEFEFSSPVLKAMNRGVVHYAQARYFKKRFDWYRENLRNVELDSLLKNETLGFLEKAKVAVDKLLDYLRERKDFFKCLLDPFDDYSAQMLFLPIEDPVVESAVTEFNYGRMDTLALSVRLYYREYHERIVRLNNEAMNGIGLHLYVGPEDLFFSVGTMMPTAENTSPFLEGPAR